MQTDMNVKEWQHMQQMATIGELTTGIVHDLKNQLACIGANMSLIEAMTEQISVDKYVLSVKRQIGYANKMIELMLRMGAKGVRHTDFDLAVLMDDVVAFFERVSKRHITVETYVDESTHLISGCQTLISNSILNLCANARDAIADKGMIEVSLTSEDIKIIDNDVLNQNISGKCSVLTIRDTGCGIEPDKLSDIFKPFFTTKSVSRANAGLGLANVIQMAHEHGVGMTVESVLGEGTTFRLYFKSVVSVA